MVDNGTKQKQTDLKMRGQKKIKDVHMEICDGQ